MLEVRHASKRYGDVRALDDVSLAVEPGRILGFLGPNGAGKTTTMRAILGLVRLDQGEVSWKGLPVGPAERLQFGYMPEERGLYPKMRVHDQLVYFARLHGLSASAAAEAADRWLDALGLRDRALDRLDALSHGNQQRVQLAAALVHDPDLVVLDEPFSGLDPIGVDTMEDVIRRRAAQGASVLFSSHQLDLVQDLVDDVAIINAGRVVLAGTIEAVRGRATHRRLDVVLEGSHAAWTPRHAGVDVVERQNGLVRLRVPPDVDLEGVLRDAKAAGEITRFAYQPPTLSDVFREAVQA